MEGIVLKIDEHLSLKQSQFTDAEELFKIVDKNRVHLQPWLSWVETTNSVEDSENFLRFVDKQLEIEKQIVFLLKYDGNLCGTLGFHGINKQERYSEIGYWLDESHQGKGVISKSVSEGIKYMIEAWGIRDFVIECNEKNIRSQSVALRLGFKEVENDRYNDKCTKIYKKSFE
jgi:ribosomal-protein-serine acetyltransferase